MMYIRQCLGLLCAIILTPHVYANTLQALDDIEQAVYLHANHDALTNYDTPQVIVEPLDQRLRLQACTKPLDTFSNSAANSLGKRTIGVRCSAPEMWTVYVPVKVKVMKPVIVAAKTIVANQTVGQSDIKLMQMDVSDLRRGYLQSKSLVIGQQVRYSIPMGKVITPAVLKQQDIVRRGEQVVLLATAGTMQVRMKGTAMNNASLGEAVKVKNNSSKRIVEGVVQRAGVVQVAM